MTKNFVALTWRSDEKIFEDKCRGMLAEADIRVDGDRDWDVLVHDPRFFKRIVLEGSLGLGESYMEGWWDCARLDEFFHRIFSAKLYEKVSSANTLLLDVLARFLNLQSKHRAWEVARRHYDIGNDLYEGMLDSRMVYSCAYWKDASNLEQAQEAKLDLICRKLGLRPGMRLLDIGCGWGGLAKFAAERYGASVVGITISEEQCRLATERCQGLPVEFRLQDYREIDEKFDRIASVGMFEHVGYKNYRAFMKVADRCLGENGIFLLHTIGNNQSVVRIDEWIHKYIFPNSMLPSARQISEASENIFVLEDWHNFGTDYDKTLMAWYDNFCQNWGRLNRKYDSRFYRMWTYYLLACAAEFRSRGSQVWQIVFSKRGTQSAYASVR